MVGLLLIIIPPRFKICGVGTSPQIKQQTNNGYCWMTTNLARLNSQCILFFSYYFRLLSTMTPPLSHADFRKHVCGVCFGLTEKKEVRNITQPMLVNLRLHQWEGYSLSNNALPTVLCGSCRLKLTRRTAVSFLFT